MTKETLRTLSGDEVGLPEDAERLVEDSFEGVSLISGPAVAFDDSLRLGVKLMDNDHADLARLINKLAILVARSPSSVEIRLVVEALNRYAIDHFRREEQLLRRYHYPDYPEHREKHLMFRRFMLAVRRVMLDEPSFVDGTKLLAFLKNWLVMHIGGSDRDYANYLISIDAGHRDNNPAPETQSYEDVTVRIPARHRTTLAIVERILSGPNAEAAALEVAVDGLRVASALDFTMDEAREMISSLAREPKG